MIAGLSQFWTYLTTPGTAVPAVAGLVIGIGIGTFISRGMWDFVAERRRFRREDRQRSQQERKAAALRRLESGRRRKAFEGLELHQSGTYYFDPLPGRIDAMFCRQCLENRLLRVKMNPLYHDPNRVHCPRCGFVGKRY